MFAFYAKLAHRFFVAFPNKEVHVDLMLPGIFWHFWERVLGPLG